MGGSGFSVFSFLDGSSISAGVESEAGAGDAEMEVDTSGAGTWISARVFCAVCAGDSALRAEEEPDDEHVADGVAGVCAVISDSDTAPCEMEADMALEHARGWLGGNGAVFGVGQVFRWERVFTGAKRYHYRGAGEHGGVWFAGVAFHARPLGGAIGNSGSAVRVSTVEHATSDSGMGA